jgi:large subunit ribosomal protein L23
MKHIVEGFVITEKSARNLKDNKYILYVNPNANKIEIKSFIQSYFSVTVVSVNVVTLRGKKRRRGKIEGQSKDRKKAIVSLKAGDSIEKVKGLF